jgi:hypothetical protein
MKPLRAASLLTIAVACGREAAMREAQVVLPSSPFVSHGERVFLHGVPIGQLLRPRRQGDSVAATLSLSREDVLLRRGDRLQVVVSPTGGLAGMAVVEAIVLQRIDLVPASADSPPLSPNDTLHSLPAKRLDSVAVTIVKGAKEVLRHRGRE